MNFKTLYNMIKDEHIDIQVSREVSENTYEKITINECKEDDKVISVFLHTSGKVGNYPGHQFYSIIIKGENI